MTVGRRALLAGCAGLLAGAGRAVPVSAGLSAALDAAEQERDARRALSYLEPLDALVLPRSARLDLECARAGLRIDAALTAASGSKRYALSLQRTVGEVSPDFAERRLQTELDRLLARAATLFERLGMRTGSVGERYRQLWRDERFLFSDDAVGRSEAVADMNRWLAELRTEVGKIGGAIPPWCRDVSARELAFCRLAEDTCAEGLVGCILGKSLHSCTTGFFANNE